LTILKIENHRTKNGVYFEWQKPIWASLMLNLWGQEIRLNQKIFSWGCGNDKKEDKK